MNDQTRALIVISLILVIAAGLVVFGAYTGHLPEGAIMALVGIYPAALALIANNPMKASSAQVLADIKEVKSASKD